MFAVFGKSVTRARDKAIQRLGSAADHRLEEYTQAELSRISISKISPEYSTREIASQYKDLVEKSGAAVQVSIRKVSDIKVSKKGVRSPVWSEV